MTDAQIDLKNIEQDNKLICYFVKKYIFLYNLDFKYKNDLISLSLIRLYKYKYKYDKNKASYSTFVSYIVKTAVIMFIRSNFSDKNKINNIVKSLDEILPGTDDFTLLETLEDKNKIDDNLNYEIIKNISLKVIESFNNENKKEICFLIMQGQTDSEISRLKKISREYVRQIRNKFSILVYVELKKNDIDLKYKFDLTKIKLSKKFIDKVKMYI